jgi:uncharacterized protein (TIGR00269 family)
VINMRQHKLALCKTHFPAWIVDHTQRIIEKYRMFTHQEKVLVAVSGGKDSLGLWDILSQLGYEADGLYIGLGIDGGIAYSAESQRMAEKFAAERRLKLQVVSIPAEYGESIPELAGRTTRGQGKPCAVCGMSKRHIMNRVARDGGYQVLATGHNLDDEAATLFGNTLNWAGGFLVRQGPVLEANPTGLVRKVKPLCRFYEREMAAYALVRGIEYIYDECPHAAGAKSIYYKELLNKLENDRPGAKLSFYLSFLQAKENGLFANRALADQDSAPDGTPLHACPSCGQPTSAPGACSFCRMVNVIHPDEIREQG